MGKGSSHDRHGKRGRDVNEVGLPADAHLVVDAQQMSLAGAAFYAKQLGRRRESLTLSYGCKDPGLSGCEIEEGDNDIAWSDEGRIGGGHEHGGDGMGVGRRGGRAQRKNMQRRGDAVRAAQGYAKTTSRQ